MLDMKSLCISGNDSKKNYNEIEWEPEKLGSFKILNSFMRI